jgi:YHS domain-containing protein
MSRNRWRKSPVAVRRVPLDENTHLLIEATVDQLIRVAPHAGFTIRDLNNLLDSGMGLNELVDCIAATALKRAAWWRSAIAIDPVCTMNVDEESTEFTNEYDGATYYFCSNACKEEFESDPERYVAAV